MPVLQHTTLRPFGYALFQAAGLPEDQARNCDGPPRGCQPTGHDSHGIFRIPAYAREVHSGSIKPAGNHKVVRETPASLTIDANHSFGIVPLQPGHAVGRDRAQQHTFGAVAVHHTSHIGRLGDFPPWRRAGLSWPSHAQRRQPLGCPLWRHGRRLPPNPIAFSAPTPMALQ